MNFLQYLKGTRGELRHVAWPTQTQTIVYTVLVIALSVLVAVYLGFFDYVFTTGLSQSLEFLPQNSDPSVIPDLSTLETTSENLEDASFIISTTTSEVAPAEIQE